MCMNEYHVGDRVASMAFESDAADGTHTGRDQHLCMRICGRFFSS